MEYNQAYLDYMRRQGISPSPQSYGDWMLRNNLGNPVVPTPPKTPDQGADPGNEGPGSTLQLRPPTVPLTTNPGGPTIYYPPDGGGNSGGGGGSSGGYPQYPPAGGGAAGGGAGGGTKTTATGGTLDSTTLTPYIKNVTTNGGNNNAMIQQLIQSLTNSSAAANKAGMAQYTNLLNSIKGGTKTIMGKGGLYDQAGSQINNYGASQKQDIEQTRLNERGQDTQDLIGKGLGNTTVLNTMLGGADTRATRANTNLGGQIAGMKSGLLERKAGMQLDLSKLMGDSILSRQNVQPDMGMFLNLLQSLGSSGGGARLAPRMMA